MFNVLNNALQAINKKQQQQQTQQNAGPSTGNPAAAAAAAIAAQEIQYQNQIKQSETNLSAQYQVMIAQQQVRGGVIMLLMSISYG